MNETTLINEFNTLRNKALASPEISGKEYLQTLTNHELKVFIAGKTMQFGRPFKASWKNAEIHLKDRHKAEILFSVKVIQSL